MDKENENTKITTEDLHYITDELNAVKQPFIQFELAKKLAYKKTASQLSSKVKIYHPDCAYETGDLIYKEYDEQLLVNSKGAEPFKGGVVLKVINKINFENYGEMLEVDYTGGGIFRKHIDYMKKTKTQVLLPSKQNGKSDKPEMLKKEDDPRLHELPMTEKDLKFLLNNLETALAKSDDFFQWGNFWQLKKNQPKIESKKIEKIIDHIKKNQLPLTTVKLVEQFLEIKENDELFDVSCMSLNSILGKKYKKEFVFISPEGWGEWFLKSILDSPLKSLPLSAPKVKLPEFDGELSPERPITHKFPLKIYLSWREINSGGIIVPKSLNKELSRSRKYTMTDIENGDDFTVYYYPNKYFFLGLKEYYEKHNIPQGASLTLERKGLDHINIGLKKSKKRLLTSKVIYDTKKHAFELTEEEVSTLSLPNKIIYLDGETLKKLLPLYKKIKSLNLRELLVLIFKYFGMEGENPSLHFLRAFHLVDILKHTSLEDVEKTLKLSNEFGDSDKAKGIFLYLEKIKTEDEIETEHETELKTDQQEKKGKEIFTDETDELLEIGTVGEITAFDYIEVKEIKVEKPAEKLEKPAEKKRISKKPKAARKEIAQEQEPPVTPEMEPIPSLPGEILEQAKKEPTAALRPKKEKPAKKKKQKAKAETEKAPRRRKGERRMIEEKIELEESELEALLAVKAKEKKEVVVEKVAASPKEKKDDYKSFISPETPSGGLFGEKLKSALDKKKPTKKKK